MRILIAEDKAKVAARICNGLKEAGHAVDVAANGTESVCRIDKAIAVKPMVKAVGTERSGGHAVVSRHGIGTASGQRICARS